MADTDVIDGQGGKVFIHGDGRVEVQPLTVADIAQQQSDAAAGALKSGILNVDLTLTGKFNAGYADAVTGKTWQCDPESRSNWSSIASSAGLSIVMGTSPLPTFTLIAADNTQITLSAADTLALFQGRVMPWVSACTLYARSLKDQYLAGNPPADPTQGWPT